MACKKHPNVKPIEVCPACLGEKGGAATKGMSTRRKTNAARKNGRLGGRPPKHSPECDVGVTGRYTENCPRCRYDAAKFSRERAS